MKKLIYSFLFLLCSVFALQAESMVVATYNLRNANAGDSTNGNGWGQRYPYIAQLIQFTVLIFSELKKASTSNCKTLKMRCPVMIISG